MSATKVRKARLHGLEPRFPRGIRALNRLCLEHPLSDSGLSKLGLTIPGYRETVHRCVTDDDYFWIGRLTVRGTLTHGCTVEILFPANSYDPKSAKVSPQRSIAFYAPAEVTNSDLQLLFIVLRWKYEQYLAKAA